jgi:hypothetical protein
MATAASAWAASTDVFLLGVPFLRSPVFRPQVILYLQFILYFLKHNCT